MNSEQHIIIIGAGLCGSLLALRLGQRGYTVSVYEKRPDLRKFDISSGRSINLAFSDRGQKAMQRVGLAEKVKPLCVPMYGRSIHNRNETPFLSRYSGRKDEFINSISRDDLNTLLLNEADALKNVSIYFNCLCVNVNLDTKQATFKHFNTKKEFTEQADVIFGADGAGSALRKSYFSKHSFLFNYTQEFLSHGYKELEIPATNNNAYRIEKNALHIWPRTDFMLIALPNLDGSFTCTLFLSYKDGEHNFKSLKTAKAVSDFFKTEFPDAFKIMPSLTEAFFNNPTSALGTIKCSPWHFKGHTLLIGDAAHAIVPFYGQGMNASFEDVVILDDCIEAHPNQWETIFKIYEQNRKINTDAIADLALENYIEMRDHTADEAFKEKRQFEMAFEKYFPKQYISKYSLVTFNEQTGYNEAMVRGRAQDMVLLKLIKQNRIQYKTDMPESELKQILKLVQDEVNTIIKTQKPI